MVDCSIVARHDQEDLTTDGCVAVLGSGRFETTKQSSQQKFKVNAKTHQRKLVSTNLEFPSCPTQKEWNSQNVRQSILDWKESLHRKEGLNWFHDSDPEPLDLENPRIKITFDQLVNREIVTHKVTIFSMNRN